MKISTIGKQKQPEVLDPYGVEGPLPDDCHCVNRTYFARAPGSDVWVCFQDLPKATIDAFHEKYLRSTFDGTAFASQAVAVTRHWYAHENDGCAFANAAYAAFGIGSPLGRLIDRRLNSCRIGSWLRLDLLHVGRHHGLWDYEEVSADHIGPSPCAQRMRDVGLQRRNGPKVPLTPAARDAMLAYLDERMALLMWISRLFSMAHAMTRNPEIAGWNDHIMRKESESVMRMQELLRE
jgi:hypothetical protein